MKTDREIIEARYWAANNVNLPSLQVAIWACRMRKILKIIDLLRVMIVVNKQPMKYLNGRFWIS